MAGTTLAPAKRRNYSTTDRFVQVSVWR